MNDSIDALRNLTLQFFQTLQLKNITLAIAESATGGLASSLITDISGASKIFIGGVVCYTAQAKNMLLDVDWETINDYGTISVETTEALLEGLKKVGADLRIAITGVAGNPIEGKPAGTMIIGIGTNRCNTIRDYKFSGNRIEIKQQAVMEAFKLALDELEHCGSCD